MHATGGDKTELRYPVAPRAPIATAWDTNPDTVGCSVATRPVAASNAASQANHAPRHTATHDSPIPYNSAYRAKGGTGVFVRRECWRTAGAARRCIVASPPTPIAAETAAEAGRFSGYTTPSMTYHAPRQKLATPVATATCRGRLLQGRMLRLRSRSSRDGDAGLVGSRRAAPREDPEVDEAQPRPARADETTEAEVEPPTAVDLLHDGWDASGRRMLRGETDAASVGCSTCARRFGKVR